MYPPFKLPVRYDKDLAIVDPDGIVVVPTIVYRGEVSHYDHQRQVCHYIVELINNSNGYFLTPVEENGRTELKYVEKARKPHFVPVVQS